MEVVMTDMFGGEMRCPRSNHLLKHVGGTIPPFLYTEIYECDYCGLEITIKKREEKKREENEMKAKYDFGDLLSDLVTGYSGVVMAITFYSSGCIHYGLAGRKTKEDGTLPEWEWLDESRLKREEAGVLKFDVSINGPSGPFPNAPEM